MEESAAVHKWAGGEATHPMLHLLVGQRGRCKRLHGQGMEVVSAALRTSQLVVQRSEATGQVKQLIVIDMQEVCPGRAGWE